MKHFGPPLGKTGLWVFAVEDAAVQVTWRSIPDAPVAFEASIAAPPAEGGLAPSASEVVEGSGGPGCVRLVGLSPGTDYQLVVRRDHTTIARKTFTTLPALDGPELSRFATISDIHIGDKGFGIIKKQRAPEIEEGFALACAKAALAEAVEWGAQAVIVKGDLTHSSRTVEVETAAQLLSAVPVPVVGVFGNHDVVRKGVDVASILARHGVAISNEVRAHDLAGIRIVLVPTAHAGQEGARLTDDDLAAAEQAVASSDTPVWVGVHHYLQPLPFPTTYPAGLASPAANRLLEAIRSTNPSALVSTGHSHRCRLHHRQGVPISEVGAPKDFPGVWAGYVVHRDGIRQVVHRVADRRCLEWNDRTRRVAGHAWAWYSPGSLDQRCFVHHWPSS